MAHLKDFSLSSDVISSVSWISADELGAAGNIKKIGTLIVNDVSTEISAYGGGVTGTYVSCDSTVSGKMFNEMHLQGTYLDNGESFDFILISAASSSI